MHVVRDSEPLFLFLSSRILSLKIFFRRKLKFFGEKTHFAKKMNKILQNVFFKNKKKEERKKCIDESDEMHRRRLLLMFRTTTTR